MWLNNLPAHSISCWVDFEDAFNANFTSTYKRPNRPQQLQACKQRENETDREFLTRWCTLRNTCEGVQEALAIGWFAEGCRHGSVLWQRLRRDMPNTLAHSIQIPDSYALGDPMQPASAEMNSNQDGAGPSRQQDRQDYRPTRREDHRHGSYQVAAVEQSQEGAGRGPKPRFSGSKRPWDKNSNQNGRRSKQIGRAHV